MSTSRTAHGATDPKLARAIIRALDSIAIVYPELLQLPDREMMGLQMKFESALTAALKRKG